MRLFVAVAVPEQVAGELEAAVAPLRSSWPSLRWTGIDAWHLTLAFLGEVNDVIAAGLADPLRIAAAEHAPLTLSLAGSGAFPGAGRAHVLWTGVHGDLKRLDHLAESVATAAKHEGAPPAEERRDFQPHLTLARSRAAVDVRALIAELAEYAGTPWTAEEIYLIRSRPDLGAQGLPASSDPGPVPGGGGCPGSHSRAGGIRGNALDGRGNLPDSEPPRLAATLRNAGQLAARRDAAPGRGARRAATDVGCVL